MRKLPSDTALWLERHVLPREPALRNWLRRKRVVDLEVDDFLRLDCSVGCRNQGGEEVINGEASVTVPRDGIGSVAQ